MDLYAVVMAGGVGARFWPKSREKYPKQLLKIFDDHTLIQATVQRLEGMVDNDKILIVTNKLHKEEIIKQLPQILPENIIEEPFGRNTAACIGLASIVIEKKSKDAVSVILPADHIIKEKDIFQNTIKKAVEYAHRSKGLITIGIPPTRPETGYGYIQIDDRNVEDNIFKVYTFAEKPNFTTAVRFIESGDFMWNSGMFIWRVDTILDEFKLYMPELNQGLQKLKQFVDTPDFEKEVLNAYGQFRNISIDYGIMEKSKRVYLTKGVFTWSDVGSWEEVYQLSNKNKDRNAINGPAYTDMAFDSYIYSPDKFTAVIGLDNIIVINTDDALLICRRDQAQEVKKVVEHLKLKKLNNYL
ncbi:MAG TPA: mannose-1-phosphate guanylyltransferase [Ignavibacteriaceae bacterium]|nr:mannose-1-phosphate guanylyltransferase [Ignavibacteriaceae bacterium]